MQSEIEKIKDRIQKAHPIVLQDDLDYLFKRIEKLEKVKEAAKKMIVAYNQMPATAYTDDRIVTFEMLKEVLEECTK